MIEAKTLVSPEILMEASKVLKVIAHPVRLKIVEQLYIHEPLSVSEIQSIVQCEQSLLSHHLIKMQKADVVVAKRDGKNMLYSLVDRRIVKVFDCMQQLFGENE